MYNVFSFSFFYPDLLSIFVNISYNLFYSFIYLIIPVFFRFFPPERWKSALRQSRVSRQIIAVFRGTKFILVILRQLHSLEAHLFLLPDR